VKAKFAAVQQEHGTMEWQTASADKASSKGLSWSVLRMAETSGSCICIIDDQCSPQRPESWTCAKIFPCLLRLVFFHHIRTSALISLFIVFRYRYSLVISASIRDSCQCSPSFTPSFLSSSLATSCTRPVISIEHTRAAKPQS
jgi:hypothetical protein